MATVALEQVSQSYGSLRAIDRLSLHIPSGTFLTLLGPSGCGKSTTLRVIAGLVPIEQGKVWIRDRDVTQTPTHRRHIGMVFQSHALFPHLTVGENVAFGLRMRRIPTVERTPRIRRTLEMVRLGGFEDRLPHQLSGGQQQRVALARALVLDPDVLLLDEPFGALDRKLREALQVELREVTRSLGVTALFVTHDQEEALVLSDQIAVMNAGRIEHLGPPNEVFARPRTRFVADFMGVSNFLRARVVGSDADGLRLTAGRLEITAPRAAEAVIGEEVEIAIRPEQIALHAAAPAPMVNAAAGRIAAAIYQGVTSSYEIRLDGPDAPSLIVRESNRLDGIGAGPRLAVGAQVWATWRPEAAQVLRA